MTEQGKDPNPLLTWPNSESIQQTVLALLILDQGETETEVDGNYLEAHEVTELAPGLGDAILEGIRNYNMPESLLQILGEEQDGIARDILGSMPEGQIENIHAKFLAKFLARSLEKLEE